MSDWYERGLDRGWDHQNYVTAYGKEHDTGVDYPALLVPDGVYGFGGRDAYERVQGRQDFARGWTDGRKLYRQGKYVDGSKIV